jgi:6-phosphogluconolactonase
VYVQTNERDGNRVLAFARGDDGTLTKLGEFATGGSGDGVPHLTSQGSVVLSGDGSRLYVTNAGSGDVAVFAVEATGLELLETGPTGPAPKSVAEHDGLVVVLNTGDRSLTVLGGPTTKLDAVDPAQVGFSRDGSLLVVTDRGTDSLTLFQVVSGELGEPQVVPSSGPTPYGFAFTATGTLVVTEAFGAQKGKASASSYVLRGGMVEPVTRSAGNGRSEICWAVVTNDDRYAFTTNFADGAVSRWAIGADGSLALEDAVAATSVEGSTGLRDEDLSGDGRFLYAIDADARRVLGWAVGEGGTLTPVGSWEGVPATVAGIAAG